MKRGQFAVYERQVIVCADQEVGAARELDSADLVLEGTLVDNRNTGIHQKDCFVDLVCTLGLTKTISAKRVKKFGLEIGFKLHAVFDWETGNRNLKLGD